MKCELCNTRQATVPVMDSHVRRSIQYDFCEGCANAIRDSAILRNHMRLLVLLVAGTRSNRTADRIQAVQNLGAHGNLAQPVVPQLEKLLHDENPTVRAESATALTAIRGTTLSNHFSET